jgi:hypothetical protein
MSKIRRLRRLTCGGRTLPPQTPPIASVNPTDHPGQLRARDGG